MCTVRVNLYSKRHNSELIDGINRDLSKDSLCICHVTFWLITFYDIPMTSEMLHVLMVKKLLGDYEVDNFTSTYAALFCLF
jgi:hypothetical protein